MKDCHKDINDYHDERVKLKLTQRTQLRQRRNANRDRLKIGLAKNKDPLPVEFVIQGSYAAKTTIQEPENAYDIDDGAVFLKEDLKGKQGGDKTALDAKKMVRDALDDGSFKTPPEVKTNCVRVHYNDGSHVDVPVYRRTTKEDGSFFYEIASADWKESDPKGVNGWFEGCLSRRSDEGRVQMRDLIRLFKAYCKHRPSYSLPSGFVLTVLVDEKYWAFDERLDRGYRDLITGIHNRLMVDLAVAHPVVDEKLAESDDPKCRTLRDLLSTSIEHLSVLDRPSCKRSDALKAWKKVFNTDFFDASIQQAEQDERKAAVAAVASIGVMPKPYCSPNAAC